MESFSEIREEISEKLDRKLIDKEIAFLKWVYQRYTEEVDKVKLI